MVHDYPGGATSALGPELQGIPESHEGPDYSRTFDDNKRLSMKFLHRARRVFLSLREARAMRLPQEAGRTARLYNHICKPFRTEPVADDNSLRSTGNASHAAENGFFVQTSAS